MKNVKRDGKQQVIRLARKAGVLQTSALARHNIPRSYLQRLVEDGILERVARGLYRLTDSAPSEHATIAEAAKRVPTGVICLLSALTFHRIGTQLPPRVWMALDPKAWKPRISDLPITFVRFSGRALNEG